MLFAAHLMPMKSTRSPLRLLLRWVILGGAFFFIGRVLHNNWRDIAALRVDAIGWAELAIALGVTLFAHICAGWVWSQILREFKQPTQGIWAVQAYLKTNIAKYLPGNVWHYYGRIAAATSVGVATEAAIVSVLLEPLLMAAAALFVAVLCSHQIAAHYGPLALFLQWLVLAGVLASVHPQVLNPLIRWLSRRKQSLQQVARRAPSPQKDGAVFQLAHYPLIPLLGELSFLLLRGVGFLITFNVVSPIAGDELLSLLGAFSLAWLLGLVIPGAPGGIGVFEATAIALLDRAYPAGVVLGGVALYRLVSVLAEAGGAGLAWLDGRREGE